jgi:hypothetical protein
MKIGHKVRIMFGIAAVVSFIIFTPIAITIARREEVSICDTEVIMKDGTVYECAETSSFDNGITLITGCDGSKIKIPTIDIKFIKIIDTNINKN